VRLRDRQWIARLKRRVDEDLGDGSPKGSVKAGAEGLDRLQPSIIGGGGGFHQRDDWRRPQVKCKNTR